MWEDILEALTLGGAGAIGGYRQAKELEEARAERERNRMREDRYRQQMLDAQKRQEQREVDREIAAEQRDMLRMGYRQARPGEQTGPMTFRPTGVEVQEFSVDPLEFEYTPIGAPKVEGGRIAGTGASAAPGQTYSAISRALEESRPEPEVRTRRVEGPAAFTPARALESASIGGRDYLRVDEGLLSEIERERDRRTEEEKRETAFEDAVRIAEMEAELQLANQMNLMRSREGIEDERRSDMIATLTPILGAENAVAFAYKAEDLTPMSRLREFVIEQMQPDQYGRNLTPEQIGMRVEQVAPLMGVPAEDVEPVLASIMSEVLSGGGGGEGGQDATPDIPSFQRIEDRLSREERRESRMADQQNQLDEIMQVLSSGMYQDRPITNAERRILEADANRLRVQLGLIYAGSSGSLLGGMPRNR